MESFSTIVELLTVAAKLSSLDVFRRRKIYIAVAIIINNKDHCVKCIQIRSYRWSAISCIWTKYGDLRSKSPYLVRIQENTDRRKLHTWTFFTQWEIYKLTYRKEMFCHSHEFDPRMRHCSIKLGLNSENSPGASALGPTWGCLQHSSKPSADCFTQQS